MAHANEWLLSGILRASIGLAIAVLLVAASVHVLRLRSPRAEQWALLLALAQGLVLVPLTLPAPHWLTRKPMDAITGLAGSEPEPPMLPPMQAGLQTDGDQFGTEAIAESPSSHLVDDSAILHANAGPARTWNWTTVGSATWLFGVLICLVLSAARYAAFLRRLKSALPAATEWRTEWHSVLAAEQIHVKVPLLVSRDMGPALYRSWRGYGVVVPQAAWSALSSQERLAVLRHELAHLQRKDLWESFAVSCLTFVHWFNPAAWWAAARFEAQAEFLCDLIAAGQAPVDYATTLVRLAGRRQRTTALVQWVIAGSLMERAQRLVDQVPYRPAWRSALPVVLTLMALVVSGFRLRAADNQIDGAAIDSGRSGAEPTSLPPRALVGFGTINLRSSDTVNAVAFSPSGKQIAAASANTAWPAVPLYDVATGRRVQLLSDPSRKPGWVSCVAFSPDRSKVAGGTYQDLLLWDVSTGDLLFREKAHEGQIRDVEFSPDGKLIASAGEDGVVQLRKSNDPRELVRELRVGPPPKRENLGSFGDRGGVSCVAFTPDSSRLVAGLSKTGDISIWRVADGVQLRTIPQAHGGDFSGNPKLNCLAVTSDGRYIMSSGQHTVKATQTTLKYVPKNVTLTEVRWWNLETGEQVRDLAGKDEYGFGYAGLSSDDKRVAVADFGRLTIRDTATGKVEQTIAVPGSWGRPPVFAPDGNIVALPMTYCVGLFDTRTGRRLPQNDAAPIGPVSSVAWSSKGDRLGTGHGDGFIRLWDPSNGKLLWKHELAPVISASGWLASPAYIAFSPDRRQLIVAGRRDDPISHQDGIVAILDADTGHVKAQTPLREVRAAVLAPDGKTMVAATSNGSIHDTKLHGVDIATAGVLYTEPPQEVRGGLWSVEAMQFEPNSRAFWVACGDGGIAQFDAVTGKEIRKFYADWRTPEQVAANKPDRADLWEATFSADCRTLVSSSDRFVYVWDVQASRMRLKIRHPHDHGCKVSLSPDGKSLATSDLNYAGDPGLNTIRLYETETGKEILSLEPGEDRAGVLAFSPDGSRLFTGFHRGTALVWDVRR